MQRNESQLVKECHEPTGGIEAPAPAKNGHLVTREGPLVSIIINFLNGEKFLAEAIESVLSQTYTNWELLLVDDGSTDTSTRIALEYVSRHPDRMSYLEHPGHENKGASAARNLGMKHAKGEYIAYLDADDVWVPEKLTEQAAILEDHPHVGMVYGPGVWWYSWNGLNGSQKRDAVQSMGVQTNTILHPPDLTLLFLKNDEGVPSASGVMIRRDWLLRVGGSEESCRSIYDDQVLYSKLGIATPIYVSDRCWYWYRQHPDQRCSVTERNGEPPLIRLAHLKWLEQYLLEKQVTHNELWQVLKAERRQLWPTEYPFIHSMVKPIKQVYLRGKYSLKKILLKALSPSLRRWIGSKLGRYRHDPPIGLVQFGDLRRCTPIGKEFGSFRGLCIDRYYIENFLLKNSNEVRGRVLEFENDIYTRRYGGNRVQKSDVWDAQEGNEKATIIGDLTEAPDIPSNTYDCIICTQVLPFIYDVKAAMKTIHRILKPGGTLLCTVPGITQISRDDMNRWGQYWQFTTKSIRRLCEDHFLPTKVAIEMHGNVLVATSFLQGLAAQELKREELDYIDLDYEVLITVKAIKE